MSADRFPFALEDITSWVVRRKDGVIVRYNLVSPEEATKRAKTASKSPSTGSTNFFGGGGTWKKSFREWCEHSPVPTNPAIFSDGKIGIWIADAVGARKNYSLFDVAIDGGSVLTVPGEHDLPNIYGDPKFRSALARHVITPGTQESNEHTRIIKLRWYDRDAPPVYPSFWPALLDELRKAQKKSGELLKVMTICQGGHGRSGSAAAALIMCMTDYTPLDALTHIRALHCARAIESKIQHSYLNLLAKELGREENAFEAENVKSFKERLLTDPNVAEEYKERARTGKGAIVEERDGAFL